MLFDKKEYKERLKKVKVSMQKKGIDLFKSLSLNAKFTLGDLFHMPIKDEQFDIVFNQGVMEHFRLAEMDASTGVKEMMRVVKKNGTLIILVPAFFSPLYFVYKIFKALKFLMDIHSHHILVSQHPSNTIHIRMPTTYTCLNIRRA